MDQTCYPFQKPESLRAASLSELDNKFNNNNNSVFNTKYVEFSTKWLVLLHFRNTTSVYNHLYNLYFKQCSPSYLPLNCSQNSPYNPQLRHSSSLPLHLPTIYTKNLFPTSAVQLKQAALRDQGARESSENQRCFNPSLLPQKMDSDNMVYNH